MLLGLIQRAAVGCSEGTASPDIGSFPGGASDT